MIITKTNKDIKKVLMDSKIGSIKEPYYLIKNDDQVIFVITQGQNGSEFNKTEGALSNYPGVSVYQCLYGQGVLVLQRDGESEAKEFKVVTLNSGRQVAVPAGWAFCIINIGKSFLVVLTSNFDEKYLDSKPIIERKGLAYFVVEKKGEIGFEPNPNYRLHPQITTE